MGKKEKWADDVGRRAHEGEGKEGEGRRGSGCLVWTNGRRSLYSTMSFISHCYWVTQLTLNTLSLVAIARVIMNSMKSTAIAHIFSGACFFSPLPLLQRGGTLYDFKYAQVRRVGTQLMTAWMNAREERKVMWGGLGTS